MTMLGTWVLLFWLCICDNGIVQQREFMNERLCETAKEQFIAEAGKNATGLTPRPKAICVMADD